jgi:hypothetical protein
MTTTETDLQHRIRFLVHWGLVEIRNLAYSGGHDDQIAHLADVLEFLPRFLGEDKQPNFEVVREQFENYVKRFPDTGYDYLGYLDGKLIPEPF